MNALLASVIFVALGSSGREPVPVSLVANPTPFEQMVGVRVLTNDLNTEQTNAELFELDLDRAKELGVSSVYISCPWDQQESWRAARLSQFATNIQAVQTRNLRPIVHVGTWLIVDRAFKRFQPTLPEHKETLKEFVLDIFRQAGEIDVSVGKEPNRESLNSKDLQTFSEITIAIAKAKKDANLPGRLLGFQASTDDVTLSKPHRSGPEFKPRRVSEMLEVALVSKLFDSLDALSFNVYPRSKDYGVYSPEQLVLGTPSSQPFMAAVLAEQRRRKLPLVILETGSVSGSNGSTRGSQAVQARLAVRSLLSSWMAGAEKCVYFELRDDGTEKFGLFNEKGLIKPAGVAVKKLIEELRGYQLGKWESTDEGRFTLEAVKGDSVKTVKWSTGKATAEFPADPLEGITQSVRANP